MTTYQNVLVAVDFSEATTRVMERAQRLANQEAAMLYIAHIVEPAPVDFLDQTLLADINLDAMLLKNARKQIADLAEQYHIPAEHCFIEIGSVKSELFNIIETHQIDCLVVGTHGRHGLGLLLGSTANSVLHGAKCDVLAVRIQE